MANIKFSQFTEKTTLGTIDFLVGYTGAENVQISPTNLLSTFVSGGGTNGQVAYFDPSNNLAGENDFFWDYTNNRLGIGTITPSAKLHVVSSTAQQLYLSRTGAISGTYRLAVAGLTNNFYITDIAQGQNRFMISASGNIGIGTDSPVSKLDVIGGVTAQGTLIATGISQLGSGGSNVYLTSSSAGNVGIGTSSPSSKLTISGTNNATSEITLINTNPSTDNDWSITPYYNDQSLRFRTNGAATTVMTLKDNGNVGIGTTSPSYKLHTKGTVNGNVNIAVENDSTGVDAYSSYRFKNDSIDTAVMFLTGSNNTNYAGASSLNMYQGTNLPLGFVTNNTLRMIVTGDGNVGIGTTSPSSKLEVDGVVACGGKYTFVGDTDTSIDRPTANTIRFTTTGTERMRIDAGGNVGIGTTSPSAGAKLEVIGKGDQLGSTGFYVNSSFKDDNNVGVFICHDDTVNNTGAIAGINQLSFITYGSSWGERMKITGSGNVGIGSTSPTSKLTVAVGDIETSGVGYGIILKSPDGTRYKVTVANGGTLSVSAV